MFETSVTVFPDVQVQEDGRGGFTPTSFADLLQRPIELPGLDSTWTHILVAVGVADDRNSAQLTLHSEPAAALSLDRSLRVVQGVPPAYVRTIGPDGQVLAESTYPAPLQLGQEVEVAGSHYLVQSEDWPGRDPDHGACIGQLDWQVVTVTAAPRPPVVPTALTEGG